MNALNSLYELQLQSLISEMEATNYLAKFTPGE